MRTRPPSDTTRLFLIRHGATDANEQKPYVLQGSGLNGGLSPTGKAQAAAVAQFLSEFAIDHVFCSPLRRALETAQAIAQTHRLQPTTLEALTECRIGEWEGLDWDTIMARHPADYQQFVADPVNCPHPGGESYLDVLNRAEPAMETLLREHLGRNLVVVAHNMVNRVYLAKLLGIDLRAARSIRQVNACVNVLHFRQGKTQVVTLNSVFHLDQFEL